MTIPRFKHRTLSRIAEYRTYCSAMDPGEILKCDMMWLALKPGKYFYFPLLVYQTLSALRICHLPRQLSFCVENLKQFVKKTHIGHILATVFYLRSLLHYYFSVIETRHLDWGYKLFSVGLNH